VYDDFRPTEEILGIFLKGKGEDKQEEYVRLSDYGITEKDICFVSDPSSPNY
jgi:hypothetical protein